MTDPILGHLDETIIRKTEIATGNIFLSYSHKNPEFAEALYAKLKRIGFTPWKDTYDIEAGTEVW